MSVEIRRLYPGDDALVKRIAEDVFDEPVRADRLSAYLASSGHMMIVALADGVVVGQCAAVIHRHLDKVSELYIDEVGVSPAYQRHGIARRCSTPCSRSAASRDAAKPGSAPNRTMSQRARFMNRGRCMGRRSRL
ncbi:GNAT family N-acetyltransferase [Mesorhizobium sp. LSJC255A00]|uniref:GNAT family N-acetyltransferase n=1 Tax=Mesorhizobium sp. LSJC255A00 TaxID=1287313 RepID=UPI0003F9B82A|nr:GNAT family N-acetyltransferase [Mesorhizobium sp. LSJC255A00]